MNKIRLFAKRNTKEILRDPINLFFGLGFPIVLIVLLSVINNAIPAEANNTMFAIENLAPNMAVFGLCFMALFSGMLIAQDRTSSFMIRLFTSPMKSIHFILGYLLPIVFIGVCQSIITFTVALFLGFELTINIFWGIFSLIPTAIMFTGLGLIGGSLMNEKAVGGVIGALLTNLTGFLSGAFIPIELIGGSFLAICKALPFYHAAQGAVYATQGDLIPMFSHLWIVLIYAVIIIIFAIIAFTRKMKSDNH